jgi:hypothetical protein
VDLLNIAFWSLSFFIIFLLFGITIYFIKENKWSFTKNLGYMLYLALVPLLIAFIILIVNLP